MSDPNGDPLFDAWEPDEPPAGFADRVVKQAMREQRGETPRARSRARRVGIAATTAIAAAAAALVVWRGQARDAHGDRIAAERTEIAIGEDAVVVLEAGAHVAWAGRHVTQDAGDVFYRVARGGPFVVHTPAGDVAVHGTCFRVKVRSGKAQADMNRRDLVAGGIGAAVGALAFVGVYEGRVAFSHANARVELAAGEAAASDGSGVRKVDLAGGEKALEAIAAEAAHAEEPLVRANQNLADSVREYKMRLEGIETEKRGLEKELASAQQRLASAERDGQVAPQRHDFDLTQEDWAELAKTNSIRYRTPCVPHSGTWDPKPETVNKLGLAPAEVQTIKDAYKRSNERVWSQLKPLCAKALGSADVAEKLGPNTCTQLVMTVAEKADSDAVDDARRQVAMIRAGQTPMPGANDAVNPVARMFLALTGELKSFEGDLAKALGPEEAHRIAFSDDLCMSSIVMSGDPRPPTPTK